MIGRLIEADSEIITIEKQSTKNKRADSTSEEMIVELPYTEIKKAVVQFDFNKK